MNDALDAGARRVGGLPGPAPEAQGAADPVPDPGIADPGVQAGAMFRDAGVILVVFLLVGAVAGAVWPHLVHPVTVSRIDAGLSTGEVDLSWRFDNDGWFSVLGGAAGLLTGLVLMVWRRSHEVVSLLMVTGSAFLASWVCATVGTALGPEDPQKVLAGAASGATAPDMVRVTSEAAYYVWPIGAVLGALLVLWSPPGQRLLHGRTSPGSDATHRGEDPPPG